METEQAPNGFTAAQSGRALELLNQGLIWLADNLRISYGEVAIISLARLIALASQTYELVVLGEKITPINPGVSISLKWPRWHPSSADDRQKDAQSLTTLVASGCISRETAMKALAASYDIEFDEDAADLLINDVDVQDGNG